MNKGSSKNPDLWLPEQDNFTLKNDKNVDGLCGKVLLGGPNPSHSHYQTATTKQAVTEVTLTVRSEDYGGWFGRERESRREDPRINAEGGP